MNSGGSQTFVACLHNIDKRLEGPEKACRNQDGHNYINNEKRGSTRYIMIATEQKKPLTPMCPGNLTLCFVRWCRQRGSGEASEYGRSAGRVPLSASWTLLRAVGGDVVELDIICSV